MVIHSRVPPVAVHLTAMWGDVIITLPGSGGYSAALSALVHDCDDLTTRVFCMGLGRLSSNLYAWNGFKVLIIIFSKEGSPFFIQPLSLARGFSSYADFCRFFLWKYYLLSILVNMTGMQTEQIFGVTIREDEMFFFCCSHFLWLRLMRQVFCSFKCTKMCFSRRSSLAHRILMSACRHRFC